MNIKMVCKKANGFILADVMIGMVILTVALTAIGGLYIQSSKSSRFADNRTLANNWALERMEYLKSTTNWRGSTQLNLGPTVPDDDGNDAPPRTGFSRKTTLVYPATITSLPPTTAGSKDNLLAAVNNRLIETKVTVSWIENNVTHSLNLETLIPLNE